MKTSRSFGSPPFRLRQESHGSRGQVAFLEAWPTGQGDYVLQGRDTYPIRARISHAGGRWDGDVRKWFVTREQALQLGAVVMIRVLRGPACCERQIDPEASYEALATTGEVQAGRMTVRFCPHCDSRIREVVAVRDVLDIDDLPELPGAN